MTRDRWSEVVRGQMGPGRPLPLGGPGDGAWLAESAARDALGRAAEAVPEVSLGVLRIASTVPDTTPSSRGASVPPPPGALPHGPLRIEAEFAAPAGRPLPQVAALLREALWSSATTGLGLAVEGIDLRVTALLDEPPDRTGSAKAFRAPGWHRPRSHSATPGPDGSGSGAASEEPEEPEGKDDGDREPRDDGGRVAAAVWAVPGVTRLTGRLGGPGGAVHIEDRPRTGAAGGAALPARHVRVEIAVPHGLHPLGVARAVRRAAARALTDRPTVSVLVTDLD